MLYKMTWARGGGCCPKAPSMDPDTRPGGHQASGLEPQVPLRQTRDWTIQVEMDSCKFYSRQAELSRSPEKRVFLGGGVVCSTALMREQERVAGPVCLMSSELARYLPSLDFMLLFDVVLIACIHTVNQKVGLISVGQRPQCNVSAKQEIPAGFACDEMPGCSRSRHIKYGRAKKRINFMPEFLDARC